MGKIRNYDDPIAQSKDKAISHYKHKAESKSHDKIFIPRKSSIATTANLNELPFNPSYFHQQWLLLKSHTGSTVSSRGDNGHRINLYSDDFLLNCSLVSQADIQIVEEIKGHLKDNTLDSSMRDIYPSIDEMNKINNENTGDKIKLFCSVFTLSSRHYQVAMNHFAKSAKVLYINCKYIFI
jgi:hypothetical protein